MKTMQITINENEPSLVQLLIQDAATSQTVVKRISLSSLMVLLQDATKGTVKGKRIGQLPEFFYDGYVNESGFEAVFVLPEAIRPYIFQDGAYTIPFPTLVMHFKVSGGKLRKSSVFAVLDKEVGENTLLYHYPFANVYEDGRICWGDNALPNGMQCIKDLEKLLVLFLNAPNNTDLWRREYLNMKYTVIREALEELKDRVNFPNELLCPMGMTVGSLLCEEE